MDLVGVEAVVEGLSSFLGDVDKINGAINNLKPDSFFENAFNTVTNAVGNFGREILNVAEVALGVIFRDAVEWAIKALGDLAASAFEAGAEFQTIELRLRGFNLQTLVDSGMEYNDAMKQSIAITKEQMSWVMKLAATTPYDATDIAFVFSMSEAFGFSADEAKVLTQGTLDFVAAMGLTGVEAKRVIINLGQMAQRGKITTREMNDLARGSLVPLRDILDRVSEKMGITTEELTKLISKPGEGVDYKLFIDAFNEMVATEVRFQDAGVRMAHTFKGAWENVTQTVRDVIGNYILLPGVLDPIGLSLGNIMDAVGKGWDRIVEAAGNVGIEIGKIVNTLLDTFLPSSDTIVDGIVGGLNGLASWLATNGPRISKFFEELRDIIFGGPAQYKNPYRQSLEFAEKSITGDTKLIFPGVLDAVQKISDFITTKLIPAFDQIKKWIDDNSKLINEFFTTLGDIVNNVVNGLIGGGGKGKGQSEESGIMRFLNTLQRVMQWIVDHPTEIANFIEAWVKFWFYAELLKLALGVILDTLTSIFSITLVDLSIGGLALLMSNVDSINIGLSNFYDWMGKLDIDGWVQGWADKAINALRNLKTEIQEVFGWFMNLLGVGGGGGGGNKVGESGKSGSSTGDSKGGSISGISTGAKSQVSYVSSNSPTNNYNLTINTKAAYEPIAADFKILSYLA